MDSRCGVLAAAPVGDACTMSEDESDTVAGLPHIWFRGSHRTWADARLACTGYDAPIILDKVRLATAKVVAGEAACERDSVALERIEYSMPLLASLLYVASRCRNRLRVLDYGGALGSSYWQNRHLLTHLTDLHWSIVEQPHFAQVGRQEFSTAVLDFHDSLASALETAPNLVLLSSLLPYVEHPFDLLTSTFEAAAFPFVVIDRTPFFLRDLPDRITVEHVTPEIYDASYPAWFFNRPKFDQFLDSSPYRVIEIFDSWERWDVEGETAQSQCYLLERRAS